MLGLLEVVPETSIVLVPLVTAPRLEDRKAQLDRDLPPERCAQGEEPLDRCPLECIACAAAHMDPRRRRNRLAVSSRLAPVTGSRFTAIEATLGILTESVGSMGTCITQPLFDSCVKVFCLLA
eukprot:scaffold137624_cov27-Tisochrysis_lutea.AAC.4